MSTAFRRQRRGSSVSARGSPSKTPRRNPAAKLSPAPVASIAETGGGVAAARSEPRRAMAPRSPSLTATVGTRAARRSRACSGSSAPAIRQASAPLGRKTSVARQGRVEAPSPFVERVPTGVERGRRAAGARARRAARQRRHASLPVGRTTTCGRVAPAPELPRARPPAEGCDRARRRKHGPVVAAAERDGDARGPRGVHATPGHVDASLAKLVEDEPAGGVVAHHAHVGDTEAKARGAARDDPARPAERERPGIGEPLGLAESRARSSLPRRSRPG